MAEAAGSFADYRVRADSYARIPAHVQARPAIPPIVSDGTARPLSDSVRRPRAMDGAEPMVMSCLAGARKDPVTGVSWYTTDELLATLRPDDAFSLAETETLLKFMEKMQAVLDRSQST